jgi:hypothetical protein
MLTQQFLANQRYKEWNHYFEFICTQKPADLQTGDKIKVNIKGSVFGVEIMVSVILVLIFKYV